MNWVDQFPVNQFPENQYWRKGCWKFQVGTFYFLQDGFLIQKTVWKRCLHTLACFWYPILIHFSVKRFSMKSSCGPHLNSSQMKSGSKVGCLILRIRSKKLQFQAYKWIKNRMDKTGTYIAAHFAFIIKEGCLD